jgi:hypothetical protein
MRTRKTPQKRDTGDSGAIAGVLANDIARCNGVSFVEDGQLGWREGCENCLRRTAPRSQIVTMIEPPPIIAFECEYLIEPTPPGGRGLLFKEKHAV